VSYWQLLQIAPDSDERSIKRAYARLLKTNRPDDNPEDFQRLREAYEAALAEARWRASDEEASSEAHGGDVDYVDRAERDVSALGSEAPFAADSRSETFAQEFAFTPAAESAPEPSLAQMQQWLAEGKDRQVLEGLRLWVASDWLLPFDRRQHFEQDVLNWIEAAPDWSPVFFDALCNIMGWDEAQGHLPCANWRWSGLIRRCEVQAFMNSVREDLARYKGDWVGGQPAALLWLPMSDHERRQLADSFDGPQWQRFTQLAQTAEYQYPEVYEKLGLSTLDNWRDWLPATSTRPVFMFLWLMACALLMFSKPEGTSVSRTLGDLLVLPVFMIVMMFFSVRLYGVWVKIAGVARHLDIALSRMLIPQALYRQGAGLLLLRHVLPTFAVAWVAHRWSTGTPWLSWTAPAVIIVGTLYLADLCLRGGKPSIWARTFARLKSHKGRLPLHLLANEYVLTGLALGVVWGFIYLKLNVFS
jgi:hypothetical protein